MKWERKTVILTVRLLEMDQLPKNSFFRISPGNNHELLYSTRQLLLPNKLLQNLWVKTMAIYVANNFVDWQLGPRFAGQLWSWLGPVMSQLGWLETVG